MVDNGSSGAILPEILVVADALPGFVWSADAGGVGDFFNAEFLKYLGRTLEQMVGWTWVDVIHPEDHPGVLAAWAAAVAAGAPYATEFRILGAADRSYRWFAVRALPHRNSRGEIERWYGTVTDISDRVAQAEAVAERERLLRTIADTAPVFIAYCTPDGRYRFVNRPYAERFGLRPQDCIGKPIADVIGAAAFGQIKPYMAEALGGRAVEFEADISYPIEGRHHMHCRYAPHIGADGQLQGFVVVAADVTPRYDLQEALTAANAQKDQFLAVLSHELRNHLSPLNMAAAILRSDADPKRAERAHAALQRQLAHLVRLVDDLLDITRIGRGELSLIYGTFDLRTAIQAAIEAAQPRIAGLKQTLMVSLPDVAIPICADHDRLTQAFTNLLLNAAKFTPASGSIAVRATQMAGSIAVEIADDGIGIAADLLPHVFTAFRQGRADDASPREGLGLGLHIVRKVVEMHGGRVDAFSDGAGTGARFVVTLPSGGSH
jgi:PAS domain S-box-containing protein